MDLSYADLRFGKRVRSVGFVQGQGVVLFLGFLRVGWGLLFQWGRPVAGDVGRVGRVFVALAVFVVTKLISRLSIGRPSSHLCYLLLVLWI